MSDTSKPRIGFIGLGGMGTRMAGRLLDAGYPLAVYNRTPQRAEVFVSRGARVAGSPRELAGGVDVVISMVADDAALDQVMSGPGGAIAGLRPGSVLVDMSTVSVAAAARVHEAAKGKGVAALDAPVSGSTPQAERGELVIFVGGEAEAFDRYRPIFEILGKKVVRMGDAGAGVKTKLCVNLMLGLGIQAVAEAVTLGAKSGLDTDMLLSALGETAVTSVAQKGKFDNIRKGTYPAAFPLRLMHKDLGLILEQGQQTNVPLPAVAAAAQWFAAEHARQSAAGRDEDMSAIVRALMEAAGVKSA